MICPACNNEMIVVEYNQIELDYCTSCKGIWFDNTELDLLLKSLKLDSSGYLLKNMLDQPELFSLEKQHRCPICKKTMRLIHPQEMTELVLDICPRNDGIWFDGGELGQLIKQIGSKPANQTGEHKVFNFLGELFQV